MDGDIFGKVTKLGRAAADSVSRALAGDSWDPFHASKCIDTLVSAAEGIPSLPLILNKLAELRGAPLIAALHVEETLAAIRIAATQKGCTVLDLMLRSATERSILRGEFETGYVLKMFVDSLLERAVITSRGGLIEQVDYARLRDAKVILGSVSSIAATALEKRPQAKRLGLANAHATVRPDTDLLGAP